jgi:hypothetical protein
MTHFGQTDNSIHFVWMVSVHQTGYKTGMCKALASHRVEAKIAVAEEPNHREICRHAWIIDTF